jgi:N-sulfoglucosamine sulfohydrolase
MAAEPRDYVHAARDRHDSAFDRVRAVRDRRFKYLRNYYPQQPYVSWIPFRNAHPIMQELMRLHVLDELEAPASGFLADARPVEELYDCEADPHEVHNLAGQPEHQATLERLRAECDRWIAEVGDMGKIAESDMVAAWYPDGVPEVPAPLFVPVTTTDAGSGPVTGEATVEGPCLLQIHSGIQGAVIEYRLHDDPHWRLYNGALRFPVDSETVVHARAERIGFTASPEVSLTLRSTTP